MFALEAVQRRLNREIKVLMDKKKVHQVLHSSFLFMAQCEKINFKGFKGFFLMIITTSR